MVLKIVCAEGNETARDAANDRQMRKRQSGVEFRCAESARRTAALHKEQSPHALTAREWKNATDPPGCSIPQARPIPRAVLSPRLP
jgi:hypothetical protein